MTPDMCVPCGDGLLNIRVGALIVQDINVDLDVEKLGDHKR